MSASPFSFLLGEQVQVAPASNRQKATKPKAERKPRTAMAPRPKPEPKAKRYPDAPPNPWGLTNGEAVMLQHIVDGLSQDAIADALCLSKKTVSTMLVRARERMGSVESARAAVMWDRHFRGGIAP